MSVIRVSKKAGGLSEQEFTQAAIQELQEKLKAKGEKITFDVSERKVKKKAAQ